MIKSLYISIGLIILISVNCGRILQSASKENDACSSIKPTNKSDCFNSVGNTGNGKCCSVSLLNTIGCKSIDIDSIENFKWDRVAFKTKKDCALDSYPEVS